jgi:hypothetical protein
MKFNWGAKIALMYSGFVVLILFLVFKSMKQDFQLVSDDYYQKEIKYQDVIDAGKNQSQLSAPVSIHANEANVSFDFPQEFKDKDCKGNVQFYSAVSSKWDASFPLKTEQNSMNISREKLQPTRYLVKINWESAGKKYYQEDSLNLAH